MNYQNWSKKKFWIIIIGVLILGMIIAPKNLVRTETVYKDREVVKKVIKEMPTTIPQLTKLSGVGQKATEKFTLKKGLVVFKMTYKCSPCEGDSIFVIKLLKDNGDYMSLLVNEIGNFDGSKAVKITETGIYLLDISADGQWTVSIE